MNKPKTTFHLRVESENSALVWPIATNKTHPEIDARISDSFYQVEDFATACFEIADMEDLITILKFYEPHQPKMEIAARVEVPEFETGAVLGSKYGFWKLHGYYTVRETEKLSPETASKKLIEIAYALTRP